MAAFRLVARLAPVACLAALGLAASLVNATSGPPRALFLRLPPETPVPSLALGTRRDAGGHHNWILEIEASGFRFTSLCMLSAQPVPVGHAHVYAAGRKLATAYLPVVDLGPLPPGRHELRVVLRAQDHRAIVGPDGLVEARTVIDVPAT